MALDQSSISEVVKTRFGNELLIRWVSSAPAETVFQVYLARQLVWVGTSRSIVLPWPASYGPNTPVDVGVIDSDEVADDLSGSLPATSSNRVRLTWQGGTYLADDIAGFNVYMSATAGASVDYSAVVATIVAYPGGFYTDGFGMGGFGQGGFGRAASDYEWTSGPLSGGVWAFGVAPFDAVGNEASSPTEQTATVSAPPQPPLANDDGDRLTYTYSSVTHKATLSWLASPG